MKFFERLFKWRLLPGRYSDPLDYDYIITSSFLGLWSTYEKLKPEFEDYLKRHGVIYRLTGFGKSSPPIINFWSEDHWRIYEDIRRPHVIYISRNSTRKKFCQILRSLNIDYLPYNRDLGVIVFSTIRMVELRLMYDFEITYESYDLHELPND